MTATNNEAILTAISYLLAKQMVADFLLQTQYQLLNKHKYGHPGGILHAAIHAFMTLPVFLFLPPASPAIVAVVAAVEFGIHYHVDYLKERLVHYRGWNAKDSMFWWLLGVDQLLHNLTYVGIVAYLSR